MKNIINFGLLISLLLGCVGTDIQGEQDEVLRITESSSTLRETETFQFKSEYIDGLAQSAAVAVSWNSSNSSIVAINDEVLTKDREERLSIPGMIEMRVDMIVVSCVLIEFIIKEYDLKKIVSSTYALKEGLIYSTLKEQPFESLYSSSEI